LQTSSEEARIKLKRLYPQYQEKWGTRYLSDRWMISKLFSSYLSHLISKEPKMLMLLALCHYDSYHR